MGILDIPDEIFLAVVVADSGKEVDIYRRKSVICLARQVCHQWRDVLDNSPGMWANIVIDLPFHHRLTGTDWRPLDLALSRAGEFPVVLTLQDRFQNARIHADWGLRLSVANLAKIRAIRICTQWRFDECASFLNKVPPGGLSRMTSFDVQCAGSFMEAELTQRLELIAPNVRATRLTSVTVRDGVRLSYIGYCLGKGLEKLDLTGCDFDMRQIPHVLHLCPALASFSTHIRSSDISRSMNLPGNPPPDDSAIHLPHLTTLRLTYNGYYCSAPWFQCLRLPSLSHLTLASRGGSDEIDRVWQERNPWMFLGFPPSIENIQHLTIINAFPVGKLPQLLLRAKGLESLVTPCWIFEEIVSCSASFGRWLTELGFFYDEHEGLSESQRLLCALPRALPSCYQGWPTTIQRVVIFHDRGSRPSSLPEAVRMRGTGLSVSFSCKPRLGRPQLSTEIEDEDLPQHDDDSDFDFDFDPGWGSDADA